jgi:hypothetical protein
MPDPYVCFYCQGSWQGLLDAGGYCCWGNVVWCNLGQTSLEDQAATSGAGPG